MSLGQGSQGSAVAQKIDRRVDRTHLNHGKGQLHPCAPEYTPHELRSQRLVARHHPSEFRQFLERFQFAAMRWVMPMGDDERFLTQKDLGLTGCVKVDAGDQGEK